MVAPFPADYFPVEERAMKDFMNIVIDWTIDWAQYILALVALTAFILAFGVFKDGGLFMLCFVVTLLSALGMVAMAPGPNQLIRRVKK